MSSYIYCPYCHNDSLDVDTLYCGCEKERLAEEAKKKEKQDMVDRIATLEAQLAEVTEERDVAKDMVSKQVMELNTIIPKLWKVEGERDAIRKNESEYLTARARGFRACDLDEPLENCANERYQHEQEGWASGWMERAVQRERDTLRTALLQVAEALRDASSQWGEDYLWQKWNLSEPLSLPVVQEILHVEETK